MLLMNSFGSRLALLSLTLSAAALTVPVAASESRDFGSPISGSPMQPVLDEDRLPESPQPLSALRNSRVTYTVGPQANCNFASLQAAINAASNGDTIRIANNSGYVGQRYIIHAKSLTLTGGFANCDPASPSGRTTLNAGGTGLLLDIWETSTPPTSMQVVLENLVLRGGSTSGVLIEGRPGRLSVQMRNISVQNNSRDGVGGGIRVLTTGDSLVSALGPLLTMDNDSIVTTNTATLDGGGIYCLSDHNQGSSTLIRLGSGPILNNSAANGGGIALRGCRNVFMYNGGPLVLAIIPTGGVLANSASNNGGGLYLVEGAHARISSASVLGFGNAEHAALLNANTARRGAGAYVEGASPNDPNRKSRLEMIGTVASGNTAERGGGAVYVTEGAQLTTQGPGRACEPPIVGGGQAFTPPCMDLRGNETTLASGTTESGGGALHLSNGAYAQLRNTYIRGNVIGNNTAGAAIKLTRISNDYTGASTTLEAESVLIYDNAGREPLYMAANTSATLDFTSIGTQIGADRLIQVFPVSQFGVSLTLQSSIVHSGTLPVLSRGGSEGDVAFRADCVIGSSALPAWATNTFGYRLTDPRFIDPASGNYRLQPNSPAIDFCDDASLVPISPLDLDYVQRGAPWQGPPPVGNNPQFGPFDLGAFEGVLADTIFSNGFESGALF